MSSPSGLKRTWQTAIMPILTVNLCYCGRSYLGVHSNANSTVHGFYL